MLLLKLPEEVLPYLFMSLLPAAKKGYKLGANFFGKNQVQLGMGLKKVQKQGRNENTRRLSCCREVVVKKVWMSTQLLLPNYATDVHRVVCG